MDMIPVTILTGFLGSGKTSLLARLLKEPGLRDTAVIVNEFGEVGLDHQLVEGVEEQTVLLGAGCLCCTVRSDLTDTLNRLFLDRVRGTIPEFERVIIETTGLADPAPIIHTMMSHPTVEARYRLAGIVACVDAVHAMDELDRHPEAVKQAAVADRLVLTKTDVADPAAVEAVSRRLRSINAAAPILRAAEGEARAARLLDTSLYDPATKTADVAGWLRAEAYEAEHDHQGHGHRDRDGDGDGDGHGHGGHNPNRHDDRIASFALSFDRPVDWNRASAAFDTLAEQFGEHLLRVKGILNIEGSDGPVAVHGVQHLFHPPARLPAWPNADRSSRVVFITHDIAPEAVARLFENLIGVKARESA